MDIYDPPPATVQDDDYAVQVPRVPPMPEAQLRVYPVCDDPTERSPGRVEASNVALPQTLVWAAELPNDVRPQELLRSFAPIANLLARHWDEPAATGQYFAELLIKRRRKRREIRPEVREELIALQYYYMLQVEVERFRARGNVTKQ